MRYIEKKPTDRLFTCDICYKTDCDYIRETGEVGKFWDDTEDYITVCGECKKREELKTHG